MPTPHECAVFFTPARRGWHLDAAGERMHYLLNGVPLCKRTVAIGGAFVPGGDRPKQVSAPKCPDCDRAHGNLWLKKGGTPL